MECTHTAVDTRTYRPYTSVHYCTDIAHLSCATDTLRLLLTLCAQSMLEDAEKAKMKGAEAVLLRVVGRVPLRSAQNSLLVLSLLTDSDTSVTVVV